MQFCALLRHGVIGDVCCFYSEEKRTFSCVMQLGEYVKAVHVIQSHAAAALSLPVLNHRLSRDVCGYPRIVHGGLTAAILDETFGFLFYAMKHHKQLPFWQPAYTAHLEVDYKAVCPADQHCCLLLLSRASQRPRGLPGPGTP